MAEEIRIDSADLITIGTVGPPGQRIFHLQAIKGDTITTFTIEKFQAAAIAESVDTMLTEIEKEYDVDTPAADLDAYQLELHEPILPVFRVAQIGLGYDHEIDQVYVVLSELLPEETMDEPSTARIGTSRPVMRTLADRAREVVAQGRPICGNCGEPIDPEGHFCPKSNGHRKPVTWA